MCIFYLQTSKDETTKKLARTIQTNEDHFAADMKSGIQRMLSEKYALIGGNYYFDSMDPETRCQVYQVGESLASVFNAVGLQKSKIIKI